MIKLSIAEPVVILAAVASDAREHRASGGPCRDGVRNRQELWFKCPGGLATRRDQYLERTHAGGRLGVEVSTDAPYVARALDVLVVAGLRLCLHAGAALDPALAHTAAVLTLHVVRRHLERAAWSAARATYEHLAQYADTDVLRNVARVHAWYARKQIDGPGSVYDEVQAWIAPSPDFEVARLSLLDRRDGTLALARELLRGGALSRIDLQSSPVLAWIPEALDEDTPPD